MGFALPRIFVRLLALLAGGALGFLIGGLVGTPLSGMVVGAAIAISLVALLDTLRGARLIDWLRGSQADPAPRDAGFWGELGYRVERAIRLRESKLAQEESRLARFLSAMEVSPNGVLMIDAGDQIDWCNQVAADHFGLDPMRDRRQRVTNLVRAPAFVAHLQGGRYDEPVVFPRSMGHGMLSVMVREYGEGMKLVLSQDITERERADMMRRDFVANVSHEIRTPLTVLSGFVETMANLPLSEVERRRVLHLMEQQTGRMQTLVGDLLTLAQLEGSPRPSADRWIPLARLLAAIEADARALSAGRHELSFDAVDGVQIAGHDTELQSAIGNLVSNAVRYTPEKGQVRLRWKLQANGSGEIAVCDTGIGIGKEHLPRLTERFYRVDGSRSRDTGGTGLGLSIVKHVAQRHGGELDIQSEPGKGSTFRLIFPAARVRTVPASADPRITHDVH